MKKLNFAGAVIGAVMTFYFLGIVVNSVIIRAVFGTDPAQTPIWSLEGFTFAAIAALVGLIAKKIYKAVLKTP